MLIQNHINLLRKVFDKSEIFPLKVEEVLTFWSTFFLEVLDQNKYDIRNQQGR
jgi:hypothetical protein